MKHFLAVVLAAVIAAVAGAQTKPVAAFEKLKALDGNWQGKTATGGLVRVSFQTTSGGFTVLQMLKVSGWPEKPTLYHLDGNRLMLTHYCSANNQPRMTSDGKLDDRGALHFSLLDITNLASEEAMHMRKMMLRFVDKDHIVQEWTWSEKGKDHLESFDLARN